MEEKARLILEEVINKIDPTEAKTTIKLIRLYDEIELFNPKYGLVNADGEELVRRHLLDCFAPVPIFKDIIGDKPRRMADLGSGSGLPGLVLASVFDNWDISLVERMGRRAGFLRNTIAMMGLNHSVKVIQKDLSEVQDSFEVITFRAFRQFKDIISDLDRILVPGGYIFAYKSSEENIKEELEVVEAYKGSSFECRILDYKVPGLDAQRRMLLLHKS